MTTNSIPRNGSMTMKAVRLVERGGAEKVTYTEAPRPHIEAGDALVRICASAITPTELTWSSTWTTKTGQDRLPSTASRSSDGGGGGLGLAISREIMLAHGGTVVASELNGWCRFEVILPFSL